MHRIDSPGSVAGRFHDGNPAIGQQATQLTADWFNDLQDNLMEVLEEGGIDPTRGRAADLVDALKEIVRGTIGGSGEGVSTDRKLIGGGLVVVSGNGDLTADREITVTPASLASIRAGETDEEAITPAGLAGAMQATNGAAGGGVNLPGGLCLRWYRFRGEWGEGAKYQAWSAPFPSTCLVAAATFVNAGGFAGSDRFVQLVSYNKDGATIFVNRIQASQETPQDGYDVIAIGF